MGMVNASAKADMDDNMVFVKNTQAECIGMADSEGEGKTVTVRFKNNDTATRYVSRAKIEKHEISEGVQFPVSLWERANGTLTFSAGHQLTKDAAKDM